MARILRNLCVSAVAAGMLAACGDGVNTNIQNQGIQNLFSNMNISAPNFSSSNAGSLGSASSGGGDNTQPVAGVDTVNVVQVPGGGDQSALPNILQNITTVGGSAQIPAARARSAWTQNGGSADHSNGHAEFSSAPQLAWTREVSARMRRGRLATTEPLIIGNRAYVLSWDLKIVALDLSSGSELWRADLRPSADRDGTFGGGLAYYNDTIYAATGAGELHAVSPSSGAVNWSMNLSAPTRSGPMAHNNRLYVTNLDGTMEVFSLTGERIWEHQTSVARTGVLAPSTAAASGNGIYTFFPNGQVTAHLPSGEVGWTLDMGMQGTSGRLNDVISDSRALPVVDSNLLIASSWSNRTAAISAGTGTRLWEFPVGGAATPLVTDNNVFIVGKDGVLRALTREAGAQVWATDLGRVRNERRVPGIGWYGPLMAGGNLILVSSEGMMKLIDPAQGGVRGEIDMGSAAVTDMALASGTLLVTTIDGNIRAYR